MKEAVLTANPRPSVWSLIAGDVDSVFDLLEQETGIHGCLPGSIEPEDECTYCDALQVCEPPEQSGAAQADLREGART